MIIGAAAPYAVIIHDPLMRARWDAEWYLLIAREGYHLEHHMEGRRVRYAPADATG